MTPHEAAVLREQSDHDARVVAEIELGGLTFEFGPHSYMTMEDVANSLAAHSLRSGTWRCKVIRNPTTHRPTGLSFHELPEPPRAA